MIPRRMQPKLQQLAEKFPIVTITGPRQSGKSTLAKMTFPDYGYVSLEDPDDRAFAQGDPRGFLATYSNRVVIDEAQRVPELFNYLQGKVDETDEPGQYILTGSHNFLLMQGVTQSLAGRTALLTLLPLSQKELKAEDRLPEDANLWMFQGGYPRLYRYGIEPRDYYPSYIQTYLERDIRELTSIGSLDSFQRFMRLCAGRVGNILDYNALAVETGIDVRTAKRWLSVLQASNLVILVRPFERNFNKRLVKRPKLYMADTGLICSLLGIKTPEELALSSFRGAVFENMVLVEYLKEQWAQGATSDVWFWQETATNEVDFIIGSIENPRAVEVKSGATFNAKWFKSMKVFSELTDLAAEDRIIVYGGDKSLHTSQGEVLPWREW